MTRDLQPVSTALVLVDLQNDFLHPDGAYGRAGCTAPAIAALPDRLAPVAQGVRERGGVVISVHFTLVPGVDGEPLIAPHLKALRPFLGRGDFEPGTWGHAMVDGLGKADFAIEKVAYSAFYMTRLEWLLRRLGITTVAVGGIVTNGGVAATVRDAHVRDFHTVLLSDGTAAFRDEVHAASLIALGNGAAVMTGAAFVSTLG